VRAFVLRDERAHSLRQAGAEIFVGDLLDIADVTAALRGCHRIYFSMSLSPYYTGAVSLMAAAARAQGDIDAFVNISEYEQSFMTFEKMTAPEDERRAWLGGLVKQWSPQQRAHWVAEQVLEWSGVPTVNVRAAMFVENPLLTWLALGPLSNGELRLPFGQHRLAPIAGYDVAELCGKILIDPAAHIAKSYDLTGPELKDMHWLAEDFTAVLGRQIVYIPEEVETWNKPYLDSALAAVPPMISLDNNAGECALRRPVVTRKNAYGSRTDDAAHLAATVWTVTATAEMAGLNVLTYLDACGRNDGKPLTGPDLQQFLPWTASPADLQIWAQPPPPN
jgi:NAD(P)H dehydrogenase (quinone)